MKKLSAVVFIAVISLAYTSAYAEYGKCNVGQNIKISGVTTLKNAKGNKLDEGLNELFALAITNGEAQPIVLGDLSMAFDLRGPKKMELSQIYAHPAKDPKNTGDVLYKDASYVPGYYGSKDGPPLVSRFIETNVVLEKRDETPIIRLEPGQQQMFVVHGSVSGADENSSLIVRFNSIMLEVQSPEGCEAYDLVVIGNAGLQASELVAKVRK